MYKAGRVAKGSVNPKRSIIIQIGTGNKYCTNCGWLRTTPPGNSTCQIFGGFLPYSQRFGPQRCDKCCEAEKLIENIKAEARKEGEEEVFFKRLDPTDRRNPL